MAVDKYFQRYYNEKVYPMFQSGDFNKLWNYVDTKSYQPDNAYYLYVGSNGNIKADTRDLYNIDGTRSNSDYIYYSKLAYEQMQNGNLDPNVMQNVIKSTSYGGSLWDGTDYYSTVNPWIDQDNKAAAAEQARLAEEQRKALEEQQRKAAEEAKRQAAELAKQKQLAAEKAANDAASQPNRSAGNIQSDSFSDTAQAMYGDAEQGKKKRRVGVASTDATDGGKLGAANVQRKQLLGM
ncbi:MAG: hypothetical protein RRY12_10805 [Cloacibacillus sp.]